MPIATPSRSLRRLPIRLSQLSPFLSFSLAVSPGFGPHRRRSARPNALSHAAPASRPAFNRASSLSLGALFPTVSLATPRVSRRLHRSQPSRKLAVRRRLFNENDGSVAGRVFSPGVTFPSIEICKCVCPRVRVPARSTRHRTGGESSTGGSAHLASSRHASCAGVPLENFFNAAPRRSLSHATSIVDTPSSTHVSGNTDSSLIQPRRSFLLLVRSTPLLAVCENRCRRLSVCSQTESSLRDRREGPTDDEGLLRRCRGR